MLQQNDNNLATEIKGKQLFKNQIHLQVHLNHSGLERYPAVVAFNTEGEDESVREIGISLLSSESLPRAASSNSSSLKCLAKSCHLKAHNLQIRGRRTRADKHYERFEYGEATVVDSTDIEAAVVKVLEDFCYSRGKFPGNMLLVAFQMDAELRWLTRYCHSIARFFSAFVDLQECCRKATRRRVGLQSSLKTCGIKESRMRSEMRSHNAGNDAFRILSLLSRLVSLGKEGLASKMESVAPTLSPRLHSISTACYYRRCRPFPTRHHPFIVELETTDQSPLPPELGSASKVLRHFQPINARRNLGPQTGKVGLSRAYICFASQDSLRAFINSVNES